MATITDVFNGNATNSFVLQQPDGTDYDLFTVDISTGVATSALLPAATTDYLGIRIQQLIALVPGLTTSAKKKLIKNLFTVDQLQNGDITVDITTPDGIVFTVGFSTLATPSTIELAIPLSSSSPFTGNASGVLPVPPVPPLVTHVEADQSSTSLIFGALVPVIFANEGWDTLNEYVLATGIFTAAANGYYTVSVAIESEPVAGVASDRLDLILDVNGVQVAANQYQWVSAGTANAYCQLTTTVFLTAGSVVRVFATNFTSVTPIVLSSSVSRNRLTIDRLQD